MNIEKMSDLLITGGEILTSAKKISRTVNAFRAVSYIALAFMMVINIARLVSTAKNTL